MARITNEGEGARDIVISGPLKKSRGVRSRIAHFQLFKSGRITQTSKIKGREAERKRRVDGGDEVRGQDKEFCRLNLQTRIELASPRFFKEKKVIHFIGIECRKGVNRLEALSSESAKEWENAINATIRNLGQGGNGQDMQQNLSGSPNSKAQEQYVVPVPEFPPVNEQGYPVPLQLLPVDGQGGGTGKPAGHGWYLEVDGEMSLYDLIQGVWVATETRPYDQSILEMWAHGGFPQTTELSNRSAASIPEHSSTCQVDIDVESSSFVQKPNTAGLVVIDRVIFMEDPAEEVEQPLKLSRGTTKQRSPMNCSA
mmetsp:Transcript_28854/g.47422  ORF Transcript_28854/g.47422 Transcript_28854/m.47422 type:complete len:312 (-) Transcript_28854:83-1018(-)